MAAMTAALGACATHPVPNSDAPTHAVNNLQDVQPLDVWLRDGTDPGATRHELGTAPGRDSVMFTFTPSMYGQQYVLEGDTPLGPPIRSRPFSVDNDGITRIEWTVDHNIVTYFGTN
jgi:hypothetical protein